MINYFNFLYKLIIISSLIINVGFSKSYLPKAGSVGKKAYLATLSFEYLYKLGNFDNEGNFIPMEEDQTFYKLDTDLLLRYGLGKSFEIHGFGKFRQVRSKSNFKELNNYGMESFGLGAKYTFPVVKGFIYALNFKFYQTAYSNTQYEDLADVPEDEIVLGDSGPRYIVGGLLSYRLSKHHYFNGYFAYNSGSDYLSEEILYEVNFEWPYKRVSFEIGIDGIQTLGTDGYGADEDGIAVTDRPLIATGDVSRLFNSINRDKLSPYLETKFIFDKVELAFRWEQTVKGISTDDHYAASVNLIWGRKNIEKEATRVNKFKEYYTEASVIKLSPKGKFVKIDQGIAGNFNKNMKIDFYQSDFLGGNILLASGIVYEIGIDWAIVKIIKYYQKNEIKEGNIARGY